MGRPPDPTARRRVVSVNLNDVEHELIAEAARQAGVPVGQWMRDVCVWFTALPDRPH